MSVVTTSMFLCVVCDLPRNHGRTSPTCLEVRRHWAHWLWSLHYIITNRRRCMLWTRLTQRLTSRTSQSSPTISRYNYISVLVVILSSLDYTFDSDLVLLANVNSCSCSLYVVVRPSVCRLSVTFVHPTHPIEIFGNVSVPFNTLVTWRHPGKILRRSSQGNPSVRGLNRFWTFLKLYLGNGAR